MASLVPPPSNEAKVQKDFQQPNGSLRIVMLVVSLAAKIFGGSFFALFGSLALGGVALLAGASISTGLSLALITWFGAVLGIFAASCWQAASSHSDK